DRHPRQRHHDHLRGDDGAALGGAAGHPPEPARRPAADHRQPALHPHPGGPPAEADGHPARRRGAERRPRPLPPQQAPRTRVAPAVSLPPATSAPPLAPAGLRPRVRAAAGVLFLALLAVWTWKLLEPSPVPESLKLSLASVWDLLPFLAAKCLHAGGYALLTALA